MTRTADDDLAGRTIIVTGGGAGVGRGLVRHLGGRGATVVVAEINEALTKEAVDEITASGGSALGIHTDVKDKASIFATVDEALQRTGRIDGLVNNALVRTPKSPIESLSEADLDDNHLSHVKAALWGMQAVHPHMKERGWGRIVNVGSAAGIIGFKGFGAYAAAKEAVRALTRTAAREWIGDGIVVNCHCPVSLQRSLEVQGPLDLDPQVLEAQAVFEALLPAGEKATVGDPESDIAPVIAFLLSDGCRYLTGQTLMLDGGTYAFA